MYNINFTFSESALISAENEFETHGEYASPPCKPSRSTEAMLEAMVLLSTGYCATSLFLQHSSLHSFPTQDSQLKRIGYEPKQFQQLLSENNLTEVVPKKPNVQADSEPCVAKFGPLPSRWQMASPKPPCVSQIADWKLKILRDGLYSIYGEVAPNKTYKEPAPFEVRLRKNEGIIQVLTNNATIQNVGGTYELHAGDIIDLIFNAEHQVLKNNTYWGVILLANPQFIS